MTTCPACGWENAEGAGRCEGCGAAPSVAHGRGLGPLHSIAEPPMPTAAPVRTTGVDPASPRYPVAPEPPAWEPVIPQHSVQPLPGPPPVRAPGPPPARVPTSQQPSVPRRSIPVRVAPAPTRQVHRASAAQPRHATGGVTWPGPTEQLCPRCGRLLPAERRFCACGADLVRRPVDAAPGPEQAPSWWSEWTSYCRFRRAQRIAGGGPVHFDSPISLRTRLVRLLLILLVLAALASQLGPWGGALRQEVATRIDQVMAEGPLGVPPAGG